MEGACGDGQDALRLCVGHREGKMGDLHTGEGPLDFPGMGMVLQPIGQPDSTILVAVCCAFAAHGCDLNGTIEVWDQLCMLQPTDDTTGKAAWVGEVIAVLWRMPIMKVVTMHQCISTGAAELQ